MQKGCEECLNIEDVWLEACRLVKPDEAKAVIARGLEMIPNSVNLWLRAAKLEHDDVNKKGKVLMIGLEHILDSVRLWKAVVKLANEDTRLLLHRAVECCPLHVELWLALGRDWRRPKGIREW
jgi:pre-mRNA-processing factor 6